MSTEPHTLMQFFEFAHLPDHLQEISAPFYDLAESMDAALPNNHQKLKFFEKLIEAKDCAVRANIFKSHEQKG